MVSCLIQSPLKSPVTENARPMGGVSACSYIGTSCSLYFLRKHFFAHRVEDQTVMTRTTLMIAIHRGMMFTNVIQVNPASLV